MAAPCLQILHMMLTLQALRRSMTGMGTGKGMSLCFAAATNLT